MSEFMDRDPSDDAAFGRAVTAITETTVKPGPADLDAARAQIRQVVAAPTRSAASQALNAVDLWSCETPERAEAVFAAAQELRDLGEIGDVECAAFFGTACRARLHRILRDEIEMNMRDMMNTMSPQVEGDEAGDSSLDTADVDDADDEDDDIEGLAEAWYALSLSMLAGYLEARGEKDLAAIAREDVARYEKVWSLGRFQLVGAKPDAPPNLNELTDAGRVAWISEGILGVLGEPRAVRPEALQTFVAAMTPNDTMAAVAAVRELRELRVATRAQAAGLLDAILSMPFSAALQADREAQQIFWSGVTPTQCADVASPRGIIALIRSDDDDPMEPVRAFRLMTRFYRVKAALFRQVGEQELANLVLKNPGGYESLLEDSGFFYEEAA